PFLVVIITTPLAAWLPYKAAAEGPLSTEMDSMSSGLRLEMPSPVCPAPENTSLGCMEDNEGKGIPSTTYSALLALAAALNDLVPRNITRVLPPMPEALLLMVTPATLPARLLMKLASFTVVTSAPEISCTL